MTLLWKLLLRRFFLVPMFCKQCGRTCADFHVDDDLWAQVAPHIKHGHVLCYDCFCSLVQRLGIGTTFRLEHLP